MKTLNRQNCKFNYQIQNQIQFRYQRLIAPIAIGMTFAFEFAFEFVLRLYLYDKNDILYIIYKINSPQSFYLQLFKIFPYKKCHVNGFKPNKAMQS